MTEHKAGDPDLAQHTSSSACIKTEMYVWLFVQLCFFIFTHWLQNDRPPATQIFFVVVCSFSLQPVKERKCLIQPVAEVVFSSWAPVCFALCCRFPADFVPFGFIFLFFPSCFVHFSLFCFLQISKGQRADNIIIPVVYVRKVLSI